MELERERESRKKLKIGRTEEETERQRWKKSGRETSAVQLSLLALTHSRTHSHCHTFPRVPAIQVLGKGESVFLSHRPSVWRRTGTHAHAHAHAHKQHTFKAHLITFLFQQHKVACCHLSTVFFPFLSSRWCCCHCLARHLWERLVKCQHSLQRRVRDYF